MDPAYITPFIASVSNVFATMLQLQVSIKDPHVKAAPLGTHDVSGIIGLTGDIIGSVALCMPRETAERIVTLFTGTPMTCEHPDFADAIGELINMISGGAKAQFPKGKSSISCPSVIMGKDHTVAIPKDTPCIVIPCASDCGDFFVEIALKEKAPAAGAPATAAARA